MPVKQLDAPCWVLAHPDGALAGQWDERHFGDEDEAADVLECELDDEPALREVAPSELAAPCFIVVCDGCGKAYSSEDDGGRDHYSSRNDAIWQAGDTQFRDDGTTWCEDCRSWDED
jgi:hypothetical protein